MIQFLSADVTCMTEMMCFFASFSVFTHGFISAIHRCPTLRFFGAVKNWCARREICFSLFLVRKILSGNLVCLAKWDEHAVPKPNSFPAFHHSKKELIATVVL